MTENEVPQEVLEAAWKVLLKLRRNDRTAKWALKEILAVAITEHQRLIKQAVNESVGVEDET